MSRTQNRTVSANTLIGHAFATNADAIVIASTTLEISAANTAADRLFGFDDGAMIGNALRRLFAVESDWLALVEALHTPKPTPLTVTLQHANKNFIDAEMAATTLTAPDGKSVGYAITFRQRQFTTQNNVRADTDRALLLARGAAHDLNNLLAIIQGNVQLAALRTSDTKIQRFMRDAEQACELASNLAGQMANFARDRAFTARTLDLGPFFASQQSLFGSALRDNVRMVFEIAADSPHVVTDAHLLTNTMLNLLKNASDAMPDGGTITINAEPATKADGTVWAAISVCDTGTGMSARISARAFDPFFTTKPPGQGTGLGLACVDGFARQSGGDVQIDSTPGKGTTITLLLPADAAAPNAPTKRSGTPKM